MAKVSTEERDKIRKDYEHLRSLGKTKSVVRRELSNKYDRGLTTIYDNTFDLELAQAPKLNKCLFKTGKTFILTAWEVRVGVDDSFIQCLKRMSEEYSAELLLTVCQKSDIKYLPDVLKDNFQLLVEDVEFNDNLSFRFVETNALLQSPLSGHAGAYPTSSIVPGLIKELITEPSTRYIKQLMSTGSVGHLDAHISDYEDLSEDKDFINKWKRLATRRHGRPTAIANNYVVPSALVITVLDDKTFFTRYISCHEKGVVYDLDKKFTPQGSEPSTPSALVVGDTHAYTADPNAVASTLEMIKHFNPTHVVLNDFADMLSVNHHIINDAYKFHNVPSLEEEAIITKNLLKKFSEVSNHLLYLQSNHDNFLTTYLGLNPSNWRMHRNYTLATELQLYRLQTGKHPIVKLLNFDMFDNLTFVPEKDNFFIGRVLVKHGHEGVSGMRATFKRMAGIYNYYTQGHSHVGSVYRNAVRVGTTSILNPDYTVGAKSWSHSNALIQPDDSQQLLTMIDGKWRL